MLAYVCRGLGSISIQDSIPPVETWSDVSTKSVSFWGTITVTQSTTWALPRLCCGTPQVPCFDPRHVNNSGSALGLLDEHTAALQSGSTHSSIGLCWLELQLQRAKGNLLHWTHGQPSTQSVVRLVVRLKKKQDTKYIPWLVWHDATTGLHLPNRKQELSNSSVSPRVYKVTEIKR